MATLLLAAGYSALVGLLYLYIATQVRQRRVEGPAAVAQAAFIAFWVSLGLNSILSAAMTAAAYSGGISTWLFQGLSQASLFVIVVALWGLLYYLIYVYTGSSKALFPLTILYFAFYIVLVLLVAYVGPPDLIGDNGWNLEAKYLQEDGTYDDFQFPGWFLAAFLVLLVGPQLGAAIAFIRLYGKVEDRSQKYRIALVSWAILVWFGFTLVVALFAEATQSEFTDTHAWQATSRLIGLVAALMMLAAYKPPKWVQRKYGIHALGKPAAEPQVAT